MTLPIRVPEGFRIIAHRGASAYAPENTPAAFRLAHEMGVHEVETDAQLTTDGEVVLCHDATLVRYGHGDAVVEERTWAELAALDMGAWFSPYLYGGERMWRLHELFDAYGDRFIYHVELKGAAAGLAPAVQDCIAQHGLAQNCLITSFNYRALAAMRRADANLPLGWLVEEVTGDVLAESQALGLYQLCPRAAHVTREQVSAARAVTPEVRAWGLSGSRDEVQSLVRRVLDAGCDGATIDWPDWLAHGPAGA